MTKVLLKPNGTLSSLHTTLYGGPPSIASALSDGTDATNVGINDGYIVSSFDTFTLPTNARVRYIRPVIKLLVSNFTGGYFYITWGTTAYQFATWQSPINAPGGAYGLPAQARTADGHYWTQFEIDDLQLTSAITNGWMSDDGWVYDIYLEVDYNMPPVPAGTGPNASIETLRPLWTWTYTDADGDPQERFRIKVFSSAQIGVAGFDPNTSTPYTDSGEIFSSATSWQQPVNLLNGETYRAYIYVADQGSEGRYNLVDVSGPYAYCTCAIRPPGVPAITSVSTQSSDMSYQLNVSDHQNLLTTEDAGFETTSGSWVAVQNCTVARSTTQAENGAASLRLTATSTSEMIARTGFYGNVFANSVYSVRAAFYTSAVRVCYAEFEFCDAGGAVLSTTASASVNTTASTWSTQVSTRTAPALTTQLRVRLHVIGHANAEVVYVDNITVTPGAINLLNNPTFEIDSNADGYADDWSFYLGGTNTITPSLDSTPSKVWAGIVSQKVVLTSGTFFSGIQQSVRWSATSHYLTLKVWASVSCTLDIFTPSTGSHTFVLSAGQWNNVGALLNYSSFGPIVEGLCFRVNANVTLWFGAAHLEIGTGASTTLNLNRFNWVRGGTIFNYWEVQRSADSGVTWTTVPRMELNGTLFSPSTDVRTWRNLLQGISGIGDYEAPRNNASIVYRVRAVISVDGYQLASQWSNWYTVPSALPLTGWWFKAIRHPENNVRLQINNESLSWSSDGAEGVFYAIGRRAPVVISDVLHGETLDIEASNLSESARLDLENLRNLKETLLVQSPYGDEYYMRFVGKRVMTHMLNPNGGRKGTTKLSLVEVDTP